MESMVQQQFFKYIPYLADLWLPCLVALVATACSIKVLRPVAPFVGLVDVPDSRKHHSGHVPLVGGIAIYLGLMVALFSFLSVSEKVVYLMGTASLVMLTGLFDDIKELGVRIRMFIQIIASLAMISGTGLYVDSLGNLFGIGEVYLGLWGVPFTVIAVIGIVNAFNMVDGIDGLAGGLSLVAIIGILAFEVLSGSYRNFDYLVLLAFALIPFLVANLRVANSRKIFLGDAGSMFMGYVIAWTLINLSQGGARVIEPVDALWCVAIPILDTLGVMFRRVKKGQSPFKPDREHLHHIFMRAGFSARKALCYILVAAVIVVCLGLFIKSLAPLSSLYVFVALFFVYGYLLLHAWKLQKLMKHA